MSATLTLRRRSFLAQVERLESRWLMAIDYLDFNGSQVPRNGDGDFYPMYYDGVEGGQFVSSINTTDAVTGNSLQLAVQNAAGSDNMLYAQFNPYGGGERGFARDYAIDAAQWQFNTYNRMSFWIKVPTNAASFETNGTSNYNLGTYVKRVSNADPSSDETGGDHYYHSINIPNGAQAGGQWIRVIINMHPNHRRGGNGNTDWGNLTNPTGEAGINYFDALTRWYFQQNNSNATLPANYLLDDIQFFQSSYPENDNQIYSVVGVYNPVNNRVIVTWQHNKNEDSIDHEVRYLTGPENQDPHAVGWSNLTAAPNGVISPPASGGYNSMAYDTTAIPGIAGAPGVWIAIKPTNSSLFSTIYVRNANYNAGPDTTPPAISNVASTNVASNSATIAWTTNEASNTQVEYGTTTSYGSSTTLNTAMVTSHSANVTGLVANTTYHYRVKSRDAAGNLQTSVDFTFTTAAPDTTAPTISSVASSNLSSTGATIAWTTNEASDTQVEYGTTTSYGSSTTLNTALVTSHTANLTGLAASTTYHYRVKSRDGAGNLQTSADFTFTTTATPPPTPVITGLPLSLLGNTPENGNVTVDLPSIPQGTQFIDLRITVNDPDFPNEGQLLVNGTVVAQLFGTSGTSANDGLSVVVTIRTNASLYQTGANTLRFEHLATGGFAIEAMTVEFVTAPADVTPPTITVNPAAGSTTSTGATISWTTDEASDTQVEYGTTASYGSSTTLNTAMVTSHSAAITGLTPGILYHYRVKSKDAAGNLRTSGNFTFTTTANGVPVLTPITHNGTDVDTSTPGVQFYPNTTVTYAVTASDPNSDPVTVTWEYSTNGGTTWSNMGTGLTKQFTYGPSTAGITYTWRATGNDTFANSASQTLVVQIIAVPDTTPPNVSTVASSNITATGATISWTTNEASDTQVEYGTTTSYGSSTTLNTALVTSHSANLTGLAASTTYHYRVKSRDAAGNLQTSNDFTFTTSAVPDTTPPTISSVGSSSIGTSGATIAWTTNEASDTQVEYGTTTSYGSSTTLNTVMVASHSVNLTGLAAGTTYHYRVKSRDAAGNLQTSSDFAFTTSPPPDTTPPTISNVASSSITVSGAIVAWTTNEASNTQVDYGTTTSYANSSTLNSAMVTSHSVNLTGLAPSTTYHYRVKSRDAAGNLQTSSDFTLTTSANGVPVLTPITHNGTDVDTSTPGVQFYPNTTVTYAVTASDPDGHPVTVTWEYSTDGGNTWTNMGAGLTKQFTYGPSTAGITYTWRATGNDTFVNSAPQNLVVQIIAVPDTTPPNVSAVASSNITATGATISWTTNEASDTQVEYGTTTSYGSSTTLNTAMVTSHSANLTGLAASTTYHYRVMSRDAAGNLRVSVDSTFTTAAVTALTQIVEDGTAGSALMGGWQRQTGKGYDNDIQNASKGTGSKFSTWTFSALPSGQYQVWGTWKINSKNASNSPFTMYDGGTARQTVRVNQKLTPSGMSTNGALWKLFGTVTVNSGRLVVKLTNAANGQVVADAVRIVGLQTNSSPQAEIGVSSGGNQMTSGSSAIAFGPSDLGTPLTRTFTVTNLGNANLSLTAINPAALPAGFSLAQNLGSTNLAPGASTTFAVTLDATAAGSFSGSIAIANNDFDENPFTFQVTGTVVDPSAALWQVIDDGDAGHQLIGNWTRNATKGHAGDMLTAQGGNGSSYSKWTFSSLPTGTYRVWATWKISSLNASNAPFTLYDGSQPVRTVQRNQQAAPDDLWDGTTLWESLGTVSITGNQLVIKLSNATSKQVVADAIRIERVLSTGAAALSSLAPPLTNAPLASSTTSTDIGLLTYRDTNVAPESQLLEDVLDLLQMPGTGQIDGSAYQLAVDAIVPECVI